jgi:hypothetical protein
VRRFKTTGEVLNVLASYDLELVNNVTQVSLRFRITIISEASLLDFFKIHEMKM